MIQATHRDHWEPATASRGGRPWQWYLRGPNPMEYARDGDGRIRWFSSYPEAQAAADALNRLAVTP